MTHRIVWIALALFVGWQGWRYLQARSNFVPPAPAGASAPVASPAATPRAPGAETPAPVPAAAASR